MAFVHLHTHSVYSLLDGTIPLELLIKQARQLGFRQLALTDHNGLYGAVMFAQLARQAGIHPIIGAQVDLEDGSSLVLLARDREGYGNLCRIVSTGRLRGGHLKFQLTLKDILAHKPGLTILSGGQKGRLWQLVAGRDFEAAGQYCRQVKRYFGDQFFVELQIFQQNDRLTCLRLRDLAAQHQLAIVASNDVHLLNAQDAPLRRVLHAIDRNALLNEVEEQHFAARTLKNAQEMSELFQAFPEAIANTAAIARECRFQFELGKAIFPKLELPDGESGYSFLWKSAFHGVQERYRTLTPELIERLTEELKVIHELGFTDYFLIVKDIMDFCNVSHIPCVGRGSAGDSLVSYVLGITQVDPLRYDLYFERFLNRQRSDPPDIDLDICWKSRDRVLDYVYQKYGETRTAMICTFNTFQLRSSLRDVAKTFGFPENEIAALTRYLPHYGIKRLGEALERIPECRHIRRNLSMLEEVLNYAERIADFPRHLSIHAGGILIAPDDIRNYTALEIAGKGIVVSQYDMYTIEPLGLVKMDLLGVRGLSVVNDCLQAVQNQVHEDAENIARFDVQQRRIMPQEKSAYLSAARFPFLGHRERHISPLDLRNLPENDPEVIALFRAGLSMACFQTESPSMRGLLRKMQIDGMGDVIAAVALVRPGAADSGMKDLYIQRRAGLVPVAYPHPSLKELLEDTYGGILYQEQVMQIAAAVGNLSLAEADQLRRSMSKAKGGNTLPDLENRFVEGARQNGLNAAEARKVWQFLCGFVGYGFNKAHSCTYGAIAYQTAFLKINFPVPYMAAVLNNQGGFYARGAYVEEARRMGIGIEPPDVNRAERDFTARGDSIVCGLSAVRELTEATLARLLETRREEGPFQDYYDFMLRARPRRGEAENLIKCGALRSLDGNEPGLLTRNRLYFKNKRSRSLTETMMHSAVMLPYSREQRIEQELAILDLAVSGHPLRRHDQHLQTIRPVRSIEIESWRGRRITFAGWMVARRRVATSKGEYMTFLTLEDDWGLCEAVLFPDVYRRCGGQINGQGPYILSGTVQSRLPGEANVIVEQVRAISEQRLANSD